MLYLCMAAFLSFPGGASAGPDLPFQRTHTRCLETTRRRSYGRGMPSSPRVTVIEEIIMAIGFTPIGPEPIGSGGNLYGPTGQPAGWLDNRGNVHDRSGRVRGWLERAGNLRDTSGHEAGWFDDRGNYHERK